MAHAHGKIILLGEHAVVYGHAALAAGIERGASAEARPAPAAVLGVGEARFAPGQAEIGQAFAALLAELGDPSVEVDVTIELPVGCGLGASAAMGVAIARAVAENAVVRDDGATARQSAIERAALAWERLFHGNPSGVDTAAALAGGCIAFSRQRGPANVPLGKDLVLAVGVAGKPASTRQMVEGLAARRTRAPEEVEPRFARIAELVQAGCVAASGGDLRTLGALMNENHIILRELGISTPDLDRACGLALDATALGAKLTGAGGGGCVIALATDSPDPILAAWRSAGIECFATRVHSAAAGVRV